MVEFKNNNRDAVIVSTVRTPTGKYAGGLASFKNYVLGGIVIKEAVKRSGIDPDTIDGVYFGNSDGLPDNLARIALLEAELPKSLAGITVNRQCGSSLDAIFIAAAMIQIGAGDIYIAGGAESMTNNPYFMAKMSRPYDWRLPEIIESKLVPDKLKNTSMAETAENVFEKYGLNREETDIFAFQSQQKAAKAVDNNIFDEQIVPITLKVKGKEVVIKQDECLRPDTTLELLAGLKPFVKKDGSVTAGNSCPMSDGASAVIVMSREKAEELNIPIMLIVRGFAAVGVDPDFMGIGPIPAVKKLLKTTGVTLDEVEMIELNEAFAAQSVACIKELNLDNERVNINGGAIALGHPTGSTGALLTVKLAYAMKNAKRKYAIVTMCCGGGHGVATLYERP